MIHWTELQWNAQSCHGLWAQQDSSKGKGEIQGLCHPFCESLRSYTAELKPPREDERGSARCAAGLGAEGHTVEALGQLLALVLGHLQGMERDLRGHQLQLLGVLCPPAVVK